MGNLFSIILCFRYVRYGTTHISNYKRGTAMIRYIFLSCLLLITAGCYTKQPDLERKLVPYEILNIEISTGGRYLFIETPSTNIFIMKGKHIVFSNAETEYAWLECIDDTVLAHTGTHFLHLKKETLEKLGEYDRTKN
jgi:hypothetical protein